MSQIIIGKAGTHNVSIDRKILMSTRLLITSDSGGGKTWLLKRLIEQAFGQVGIIVIDPEGEFAPLRTKFDFFLVGKGGDTPADIRTAEKVARTLLTGRASAICDIYEMPASERHIWVQRFLDALLDAPKELRHPYFVIVDESHMFCMDAETEILTYSGWKSRTTAAVGDLAVCFDVETEAYRHEPIQRVIHREYTGEMVTLKSDGIDALVTTDHRVVAKRIQRAKGRYKVYKPTIIPAQDVPNHIYIPAAGGPEGKGIESLSPAMCRVLGSTIPHGY